LRGHLDTGDAKALDLVTVIERLVDSVEILGGPEAAIVLRKRPEAGAT
jgi:hypothetical protein